MLEKIKLVKFEFQHISSEYINIVDRFWIRIREELTNALQS